MAKKKEEESWKEIIGGIIVLLIFILLLNNSGDSDGKSLEYISISGMNEVVTINNANPLSVDITGMGAIVYFSKTSNPKEI